MNTPGKSSILVVDDDPDALDLLQLVLSGNGYNVRTLNTGKFLRDYVVHYHPDLIVMDLMVSGYDGREICAVLKAHKDTSQIPVIMVSGHHDAEMLCRASGADDFLGKPFNREELFRKVNQNLRKGQALGNREIGIGH